MHDIEQRPSGAGARLNVTVSRCWPASTIVPLESYIDLSISGSTAWL